MRVAISSDIHLEFGPLTINNDQAADVLILAGDICVARDFELADKNLYAENKRAQRYLEFFNDVAAKFPKVIYIMGNHEHYNGDFAYTYSILKRALEHLPNLHLLEKETLDIGDYTFIGATIWTDMNGGDPITMMQIKSLMNDFHGVKNSNQKVTRKVPLYDDGEYNSVRKVIGHKFKEEAAKFTPQDAAEDHKRAVDYINHVVMNDETKKYVVVGHHAPCGKSIHKKYVHDRIMNGAFYTELGDFIAYHPQIKLWVHGHMHDPFDYVVGETRVICNPRGYTGYESRADEFKLMYVDLGE
jgi:Icc-related predicted phosphoesterase